MAQINQIYQVLNLATQEAWGDIGINVIDNSTLISLGNYVLNSSTSKDVWTGKLTDIIGRTIFVERALDVEDLGIRRDEFTWGAIMRKIRVKPKLVEHNQEYDLGTEEFNPFEITTPEVYEMLFSKFGTFESQVTITDEQLFTAFKSEVEMTAFYSMIFKQLEDSMARAIKSFDRLALVNFIGEKLNLQTTQPSKLHAINLLAEYNTTFEKTLTAAQSYTDPDFLRYFAAKLIEFKGYIAADTAAFNASDGYPSQTPENYLNLYILNSIDAKLNSYLYSTTFHDDLIKVNNYKTVKFWQGVGNENPFSPENTSKINITLASDGTTTIEQSGIIAVMTDVDAVATYYNREKAESWRIPKKGTNHWKAITRMMINDLYENGIIFYVADAAPAE